MSEEPTAADEPQRDEDGGRPSFFGPGHDGHPDSPRWRSLLGSRKRVFLLALLPLLVLGILLLVSTALGEGALLEAAERADARWFAACIAGEMLAYLGYVLVFRTAASVDGGPRLRLRTSLHIVFAALGATRLLAAGGAGGLGVFYWALRKAGVTIESAIVRVLGLNVFIFAVFGLGAWLAAIALVFDEQAPSPLAITIPWIIGAPTLLVLLLAARGHRGARLSKRWPQWLRTGLASVAPGIGLGARLVGERRCRRTAVPGGLFYWAGDIICLWAGLQAFGVQLTLDTLIVAYATGYLATMLPLPTGAEGGIEAAMIFALVALGAPLAPSILGVLVYRLFSFWAPTIPALLALPTLTRLGRRLEREAAVAPAPEPVGAPSRV